MTFAQAVQLIERTDRFSAELKALNQKKRDRKKSIRLRFKGRRGVKADRKAELEKVDDWYRKARDQLYRSHGRRPPEKKERGYQMRMGRRERGYTADREVRLLKTAASA